jgi:hypothetical protein
MDMVISLTGVLTDTCLTDIVTCGSRGRGQCSALLHHTRRVVYQLIKVRP